MFSIHPKNGLAETNRPHCQRNKHQLFSIAPFNIFLRTANAGKPGQTLQKPKKRAYLLL
jgi:hypothetical protein